MRIQNAITCLLFLFFLFQTSFCAGEIRIYVNEKQQKPNPATEWFLDTGHLFSLNRYQQIEPYFNRSALPSLSYQPGMFWIKMRIPQGVEAQNSYLRINNPHINLLNIWILDNEKPVLAYRQTGDHRSYVHKDVQHHQFVFHLPDNAAGKELLILMDKRYEPLYLSLYFENHSVLLKQTISDSIAVALITGIALFVLLFTLFLYINLKERLFVYYAFYVLIFILYVFFDTGFDSMYLFKNYPGLNDYARPTLIVLAPVFYLLFTLQLLSVKKHFPRLNRYLNRFLAIYLLWYFIAVTLISKEGANRTWLLTSLQIMIISGYSAVLVSTFMCFRKRIEYAGYVLTASVLFIILSQLYIYYLSGDVPDNYFNRHSIKIGFFAEIAILTIILSLRFRNYKQEATQLLEQLNVQQEQVHRTITESRERQMQEISGVLHNNIGAGLSAVKFNLETVLENGRTELMPDTVKDLTAIAEEIRNIAHAISPIRLQQNGLVKSLELLIQSYSRTGRIQIVLENIGSLDTASYHNNLLIYQIMQEILQNTIKHAEATEMHIQLMLEPELISVYAEDNGKGFDVHQQAKGLGLNYIANMVQLVKGRCRISSHPNEGTTFSIEIPVFINPII